MSQSLDNLQQAATNFGIADAALESAVACRAPHEIVQAMAVNRCDAKRNLIDAALQYHQDTFDGAPE